MHDRYLPTVEAEGSEALRGIYQERRGYSLVRDTATLPSPTPRNALGSKSRTLGADQRQGDIFVGGEARSKLPDRLKETV